MGYGIFSIEPRCHLGPQVEPSKAAMKAALRVLTALSEHQEPDQADLDELHWYAPSERQCPIDELACEAIQRALKDREQKRKALRVELRERALAFASGGTATEVQARLETARLVREHTERRKEYANLTAKLKRVGAALQWAAANLAAADNSDDSGQLEAARGMLAEVAGDVDITGIQQLLDRHARLGRLLAADEQVLRKNRIPAEERR